MEIDEGPLNLIRGTRIGDINRKIEGSVAGIIDGIPGAAAQALLHAREREAYLCARPYPEIDRSSGK